MLTRVKESDIGAVETNSGYSFRLGSFCWKKVDRNLPFVSRKKGSIHRKLCFL